MSIRIGDEYCLYAQYTWNKQRLTAHDGCNEGDDYYWMYTTDKQLMTSNRFDCLTLGSDNEVTISPCRAGLENQQWYCDDNGTLYSQDTGTSPRYADGKFSLTTTNSQEWRAYDPTNGSDIGSVCHRPIAYQGGSDFNDR